MAGELNLLVGGKDVPASAGATFERRGPFLAPSAATRAYTNWLTRAGLRCRPRRAAPRSESFNPNRNTES